MPEFMKEQQMNERIEVTPPREWLSEEYCREEIDWSDAEVAEKPIESLYIDLERNMKQHVIGQDAAVEKIMRSLSREKMRNPDRPIANLLFLGPTGVGKTEAAKSLSYLMHKDESGPSPFLKIDCSQYSSGHTIAALIGSPPGYVGRDQSPLLDKKIIEQDRSVVLFDEIEKGSQKLWDLLLSIMDEGEIELVGTGEKVSFRNSIIIMTSNLGAGDMMRMLDANGGVGFRTQTAVPPQRDIEKAATEALKRDFRPEFIARIDQKIVFNPLDDEGLAKVLDNYVETANSTYYDSVGVTLFLSDALRTQLVTSVSERDTFGARPILRQYDQYIEGKLSEYVEAGSIPEGSFVLADVGGADTPLDIVLRHKPDREYRRLMDSSKEVVLATPNSVASCLGSSALGGMNGGVAHDPVKYIAGLRAKQETYFPSSRDTADTYII